MSFDSNADNFARVITCIHYQPHWAETGGERVVCGSRLRSASSCDRYSFKLSAWLKRIRQILEQKRSVAEVPWAYGNWGIKGLTST